MKKGIFISKITFLSITLTLSLLSNASLSAPNASTQASDKSASQNFNQLVDAYFENYFSYHPTQATQSGFHEYDTKLEDYSKFNITKNRTDLHRYEKLFMGIPRKQLGELEQGDLDLILSDIRSQLLTIEILRPWENNPDIYPSAISGSTFTLMSRHFASPENRLRALIAREKQMPGILAAARNNLKNPPHEFTEIALSQLPGIINFFKQDVPLAFKEVTNKDLLKEFSASNNAVIDALSSYEAWLSTVMLPKSNGRFQIGAENFRKKLLYDEMVNLPLDQLLKIGQADMEKNQANFVQIAKQLDPKKMPLEVFSELTDQHPKSTQLLQNFHDQFDGLITFIQQKHIITIPSKVQPIVEETPPFLRATTFASMDIPGPYEKVAKEAYFNVTLPDKNWSTNKVDEFMHAFNIASIPVIAIHEAYPGHYVQFLWVQQAPSKVRKLLGSRTNAEGWAHYCEQMLLDEGYGQVGVGAKNVRQALFIKLGQIQLALIRDARFIVGLKLHTDQMTFTEAVDFFIQHSYLSPTAARMEALRATYDPTYLYYTLGKLEILKLRDDVKKKQGTAFSLEKFHDEFMQQGFPPIKIVRRAMLGDNSPTL